METTIDSGTVATPAEITPAVESVAESTENTGVSDDTASQADPTVSEEKPEPSFRERMQAKAAEIAKNRAQEEKTRAAKPASEKPQKQAETGEKPTVSDPKTPAKPLPTVAAGEKAAFAPNVKLKVMDQDCEVPELLRPLMKDAASEKAIREFAEKALGLDYVKPKLEQSRQQVQQVSSERDSILGHIDQARQLYQRGDIDGWLKKLQVPEERILQWVADKINYNQLPQEQRQNLDARRQAEERAWQAEQQVTTYQGQHEQLLTQQVQGQLESVLARPEIKSVADAFDARVGKPGSFKQEINRRGDYAWRTRNELVQPEQLVQEMLSFLGPTAPAQAQAASSTTEGVAPQPGTSATAPAKKAPPVIPNISGRSTSAISSPVRSLDDLRKRAKDLRDSASS